jgi:hypothetical protein
MATVATASSAAFRTEAQAQQRFAMSSLHMATLELMSFDSRASAVPSLPSSDFNRSTSRSAMATTS